MHVLLLTLTILSTHDVRLYKQICFLRCQPVGHKLYVSDRMTLEGISPSVVTYKYKFLHGVL